MNTSGSKTNGNNKLTNLTNLTININSQHIQHHEVGDTCNYTEQNDLFYCVFLLYVTVLLPVGVIKDNNSRPSYIKHQLFTRAVHAVSVMTTLLRIEWLHPLRSTRSRSSEHENFSGTVHSVLMYARLY